MRHISINGPQFLIILSCSKKKRDVSEGRAIELYDGPFFRLLRKRAVSGLYVLILSAKYGLIDQDKNITNYDQLMDHPRALALQEETAKRLQRYLKNNNFRQIYINVGKTYAIALEEAMGVLDQYPVIWGSGEIGERLHQMKQWLVSLNGEGSVDH